MSKEEEANNIEDSLSDGLDRSKRTTAVPANAGVTEQGRPRRLSKPVERLPEVVPSSKEKDLVFVKGRGMVLSDIDHVVESLKEINAKDAVMTKFHRLLYNTPAEWTVRRKNILRYSGVPEGEEAEKEARERMTQRLGSWFKTELAQLHHVFWLRKLGVSTNSKVEDLTKAIVDFLISPKDLRGKSKKSLPSKPGKKEKKKEKKEKGGEEEVSDEDQEEEKDEVAPEGESELAKTQRELKKVQAKYEAARKEIKALKAQVSKLEGGKTPTPKGGKKRARVQSEDEEEDKEDSAEEETIERRPTKRPRMASVQKEKDDKMDDETPPKKVEKENEKKEEKPEKEGKEEKEERKEEEKKAAQVDDGVDFDD